MPAAPSESARIHFKLQNNFFSKSSYARQALCQPMLVKKIQRIKIDSIVKVTKPESISLQRFNMII